MRVRSRSPFFKGGPSPVFLNPVFQGSSCIHCAALHGQSLWLENCIISQSFEPFRGRVAKVLVQKLLRAVEAENSQKRSGDPNPQYFSKSTAVQMGGVLPYKWEAYCSTNGRRIAGFPFLRSLEARKARRYGWGAYCRTNGRCTAVLFRQVVGVGVSETLPKQGLKNRVWLRRVKSTPDPDTFEKVSRYTSHFYRDTFAKICPPLGRK